MEGVWLLVNSVLVVCAVGVVLGVVEWFCERPDLKEKEGDPNNEK